MRNKSNKMNDKTLQVVIKAVDDASAQLATIKAKAAELEAQFGQNSDGLKQYMQDEKNANDGNESMTASIFKGVAAWDMLKEGLQMAKEFIEDAIGASAKASETMAIVKTNVENAGYSYDEISPKLQAYSEQMAKLGFDHEDTSKSVSKLLLITGNYSQAIALNNLAMDLSRNKSVSLETATTSLAQVLQGGGAKALTQYGLTFKDGASSAEILLELQDKLKNSATSFADSAGGKLEILNTQWEEIQKQIGDAVMPTVIELVDELEKNLPDIIEFVKETAAVFVDVYDGIKAVLEVAAGLPIIKQCIEALQITLNDIVMGFQELVAGIRLVTGTTESYAKSQTVLSDGMKGVIEKWNELHKNATITEDDFKQMDSSQQVAIYNNVKHKLSQSELNDVINGTSNSVKSQTAALGGISTKAGSTADDLEKLKTEYQKMSDSATADITDLATTHTAKMQTISDSIQKVTDQINKLTASYNETSTNDTASVADKIVASQQKIADLKKQISAATTSDERQKLTDQLNDEQKNYDSSLAFQQQNQAAMTEATRRASETDLQRTIEDYAKKQALAKADYLDQIKTLNDELTAKGKEQQDEIALYNQKVATINAVIAKANEDYKSFSDARVATTKAEVDKEISYYQQLAAAISKVKSATSVASIGNTTTAVSGARASGGDVNSGEAYLVGEKGAEIFVPNSSGTIIPNGKTGGSSITVNINGGNYLSQDAARLMSDYIVKNLQRVVRI